MSNSEYYLNSDKSFIAKDAIKWHEINQNELAEVLAQCVIYNSEDIIAFNKPADLPYSGSKSTRLQIDRALHDVRKIVAKECDRLNLVESLDRCASGVIYFAKNVERQKELKQKIEEGKVAHRFRVVCRGKPIEPSADITIPLHKISKGQDIRWMPLLHATSHGKSYETTRYKLINEDLKLGVCLLDVFVNKSSAVHQIRSHLSYGINCPLLGEAKYNTKEKDVPINISPRILKALEMEPGSKRKIPMLIHLAEVLVPIGNGSKFSVIKAPYPTLFINTLKFLSLFKK